MKHYHFTTVVKNQLKRSEDVLLDKSEEYATSQDRLHNFRVAASMQGCTPKEALAGMMAKHTVSIFDMVREDDEDVPLAQWNEKITDHINYLLLLRALVEEDFMGLTTGKNSQGEPAFPPMDDYRTPNQYVSNNTIRTMDELKKRYPDLKIHETVNYKSKEERDAGKQTSNGVLEERDREIPGRATETTEQD